MKNMVVDSPLIKGTLKAIYKITGKRGSLVISLIIPVCDFKNMI